MPELIAADGSRGYSACAPYDRILLSAGVRRQSFSEAPLVAQLAEGGILLYPEARGRLFRVARRGPLLVRDSWLGVAFVRLRTGRD